jgi:hypothetical protein
MANFDEQAFIEKMYGSFENFWQDIPLMKKYPDEIECDHDYGDAIVFSKDGIHFYSSHSKYNLDAANFKIDSIKTASCELSDSERYDIKFFLANCVETFKFKREISKELPLYLFEYAQIIFDNVTLRDVFKTLVPTIDIMNMLYNSVRYKPIINFVLSLPVVEKHKHDKNNVDYFVFMDCVEITNPHTFDKDYANNFSGLPWNLSLQTLNDLYKEYITEAHFGFCGRYIYKSLKEYAKDYDLDVKDKKTIARFKDKENKYINLSVYIDKENIVNFADKPIRNLETCVSFINHTKKHNIKVKNYPCTSQTERTLHDYLYAMFWELSDINCALDSDNSYEQGVEFLKNISSIEESLTCPGCADKLTVVSRGNNYRAYCPTCKFEMTNEDVGKASSKSQFITKCEVYLRSKRNEIFEN